MNDDDPPAGLDALKSKHRQLDEQIRAMIDHPDADQLEIARLKKQKLRLKDQIQLMIDSSIPDIIA